MLELNGKDAKFTSYKQMIQYSLGMVQNMDENNLNKQEMSIFDQNPFYKINFEMEKNIDFTLEKIKFAIE